MKQLLVKISYQAGRTGENIPLGICVARVNNKQTRLKFSLDDRQINSAPDGVFKILQKEIKENIKSYLNNPNYNVVHSMENGIMTEIKIIENP